ncbi:MAG TPA: class I SAM-dependent methyltransferase [Methanospirillum sp.]|nr:class I SAM-dependent methyltransferase [Methanospirillum sp.]
MKTDQALKSHGIICTCTPWTVTMLDNLFRRFLQNPQKILGKFIRPGMTVLDIGCGPGFFTLPMAKMVGPGGKVIGIDVQKEMLDLVMQKSEQLNMGNRIQVHQCNPDAIGIHQKADFILSFYMVHEVPDRDAFFTEVAGLLAPEGKYLVVEPFFHVSSDAFNDTLVSATKAGLRVEQRPNYRLSHAALLGRGT